MLDADKQAQRFMQGEKREDLDADPMLLLAFFKADVEHSQMQGLLYRMCSCNQCLSRNSNCLKLYSKSSPPRNLGQSCSVPSISTVMPPPPLTPAS